LPEFYAGADILLSLCIFDTCPNVVCEGLASGLPVLTLLESGAAELVGKEQSSWVVEEGLKLDYYPLHIPGAIPQIPLDTYADCFNTIWEHIKTEKNRARAHAEAHLDIRRVARRYETFIQECMGQRSLS
jgi:glycosyltransferase involved in cell wall biosynthesis